MGQRVNTRMNRKRRNQEQKLSKMPWKWEKTKMMSQMSCASIVLCDSYLFIYLFIYFYLFIYLFLPGYLPLLSYYFKCSCSKELFVVHAHFIIVIIVEHNKV